MSSYLSDIGLSDNYSSKREHRKKKLVSTAGETIVFLSKIPQPPRVKDPNIDLYEDLIEYLEKLCTISGDKPQCQIPSKTRALPYMYAFLNYRTHTAAAEAVHMLDNVILKELGCQDPLIAKITSDRRKTYSQNKRFKSDSYLERESSRDRNSSTEKKSDNSSKFRYSLERSPVRHRHYDRDMKSITKRSKSPNRSPLLRRSPISRSLIKRSASPLMKISREEEFVKADRYSRSPLVHESRYQNERNSNTYKKQYENYHEKKRYQEMPRQPSPTEDFSRTTKNINENIKSYDSSFKDSREYKRREIRTTEYSREDNPNNHRGVLPAERYHPMEHHRSTTTRRQTSQDNSQWIKEDMEERKYPEKKHIEERRYSEKKYINSSYDNSYSKGIYS